MKSAHRIPALILGFFVMVLSIAMPAHSRAQAVSTTASGTAVTSETQPAFTVVGYAVRTDNQKEKGGNGDIPQLWQRVTQQGLLADILHRADQNFTVVYTDYASDQNGEYTYVLGVRVTSVDTVPDGMTAVTVPAGKYAIVTSDTGTLPDILPKVWQRIWAMTPAELGGQRAFKADYEVYPEGFDWQNAQVAIHIGVK